MMSVSFAIFFQVSILFLIHSRIKCLIKTDINGLGEAKLLALLYGFFAAAIPITFFVYFKANVDSVDPLILVFSIIFMGFSFLFGVVVFILSIFLSSGSLRSFLIWLTTAKDDSA